MSGSGALIGVAGMSICQHPVKVGCKRLATSSQGRRVGGWVEVSADPVKSMFPRTPLSENVVVEEAPHRQVRYAYDAPGRKDSMNRYRRLIWCRSLRKVYPRKATPPKPRQPFKNSVRSRNTPTYYSRSHLCESGGREAAVNSVVN